MAQTQLLIPGQAITITATAAGTLTRLQNQSGVVGELSSETLTAGDAVTKGPFTIPTRWQFPEAWTHTIDAKPGGIAVSGATHDYVTVPDGGHVIPGNVVALSDDFTGQAIDETNGLWILNSGTDAQAIDPAINVQAGGVMRIVTGNLDGTMAADGSQAVCHLPVTANKGGLVAECRINIDTAITDVSCGFGFTDVTTLEEPFSVGAADAITSNASDGVAFVYDTGAATDQWFFVGVAGDTDATGSAVTGVAPVADTWQTLRIEIDADGASARGYINGALVGTLTASAVTAATSIYATVWACATTTTSKTVDVDYIYVGYNR